ncbi:MAG: MBL fold metallo-hydrolase [bacterium]|nr:MBL fold metallo-hydrolase [bacterium]
MKIRFLGTNGWYSTKTGNTVCTLIETKDCYIVLDAGEGIYRLDKYVKSKKPVYLFLSHFHLDHIYGIHIFDKFNFRQGIKIFGQPGTKKFLNKIGSRPFVNPLGEQKNKITIRDLAEGVHREKIVPFPLEARYLVHAEPCFGYRFEIEGKTVAYCTDTGICDNLLRLARGVDVLILECAMKDGKKLKSWPHLAPLDCAKIAKKAGVKNLFLIHFDALQYQSLKERKEAEIIARKIFKNTTACQDEFRVDI